MRNIVLTLLSSLFLLSSCEETVTLDSTFETPSLVVDAWLNTKGESQTVTLSLSQDYFSSNPAKKVSDATVSLSNETTKTDFDFDYTTNGQYVWTPATDESLGVVDDTISLTVEYDGVTYTSQSTIKKAPEVRLITFIEPEEEEDETDNNDDKKKNVIEYEGQVYAKDFKGTGDTYWIKTFKNGVYLSLPRNINFAYDDSAFPGSELDGGVFIKPIRTLINGYKKEKEDDKDFSEIDYYKEGDSCRVEIHSLSRDAFDYLNVMKTQLNTTPSIFSKPVISPKGNIKSSNDNKNALGIFNVAVITFKEVKVKKGGIPLPDGYLDELLEK